MYPIALSNSVHTSLIGAEFPTRIKGVQQVFFPRMFKILLHNIYLFLPIKYFFAICSVFLTFPCTQFSLILLIFFLNEKFWPVDVVVKYRHGFLNHSETSVC